MPCLLRAIAASAVVSGSLALGAPVAHATSQDCVGVDPANPAAIVRDPWGRPVATVPGIWVNPVLTCLKP